jgi:NAD(P)-dependent dehydrogenase (short-subunit alcohol dehydrogenase family)
MRGLTDRVVLVTGAGGGIGQGIARRLDEEGCRLVLADLDLARAEGAARGCANALAVAADVSSEHGNHQLLENALDRFGRLDGVVLNAGVSGPFGSFADLPVEAYDRVVATNQRGVFLGLRTALRHFRETSYGGSAVVIASLAGLRPSASIAAYTASKSASIALARAAAQEGASTGLRVNVVAPGLIDTPLLAPLLEHLPDQGTREALLTHSPLGRPGTVAEVGALAAFLLSDEASYITGGVHLIDGGVDVRDPMSVTSMTEAAEER